MCGLFRCFLILFLVITIIPPSMVRSARIKDMASIKGIRPNQLFGYGLVIGLDGTGDSGKRSFTIQSLANMLEREGIHVLPIDMKVDNVAAVMVSATLPAFAKIGKKIDVTISSIGDADSLHGGTLLITPLKGSDGRVYALAQGPVSVGGFSAGGDAGGGVTKNHPTVGRISGGATVEREISFALQNKRELTLILDNPDFTTAVRVTNEINRRFGAELTRPLDSGTLKIAIPMGYENNIVQLMAHIGDLEVTPDAVAKVIANERTGTVVIGENVRISKVAIAHGNLSIQIKETKEVSQALPFAPEGKGGFEPRTEGGITVAPGGSTVVTPDTDVTVEEEKNRLILVPEGRTLGDLVKALNAIGVGPRDLITILQSIKAAGALQGELEIL
jgi:flagellar P-ring protein precursor FlgI